jgi:hypothetical protein
MLPASFAFGKSANHKFLLRPGLDLEPIGTPFPRPVNAIFALGHYAFHAFRFGKVKECLTFAFDKASKLNAAARFDDAFQHGSTFHNSFPGDIYPDSGSFQFSQSPAKVNGRPSFMAIANGSFRLAVLRHS